MVIWRYRYNKKVIDKGYFQVHLSSQDNDVAAGRNSTVTIDKVAIGESRKNSVCGSIRLNYSSGLRTSSSCCVSYNGG